MNVCIQAGGTGGLDQGGDPGYLLAVCSRPSPPRNADQDSPCRCSPGKASALGLIIQWGDGG